jgi:hypothetical protein
MGRTLDRLPSPSRTADWRPGAYATCSHDDRKDAWSMAQDRLSPKRDSQLVTARYRLPHSNHLWHVETVRVAEESFKSPAAREGRH